MLDESIHALVPDRVFDPIDVGFNALAGSMAIAAAASVSWARRRSPGRSSVTAVKTGVGVMCDHWCSRPESHRDGMDDHETGPGELRGWAR